MVLFSKKKIQALIEKSERLERELASLQNIPEAGNAGQTSSVDAPALEAILDNVEEAIYLADTDVYEIVYMNRAAEGKWGKAREGQKCYEIRFKRTEACEGCQETLARLRKTNSPFYHTYQEEETQRWYRSTLKTVNWPDGRNLRFELLTETTAIMQYDENLKEANDQLISNEKSLREANKKLQDREKELEKALERALESDRLKRVFLANLSHEIRTPMNGILGFIEMLGEPSLEVEDQSEFLSTIEKCSKRLLDTINSLVDISKIETGHVSVWENEVNIQSLFEEIKGFTRFEVQEKGLDLRIETAPQEAEEWIVTDNMKLHSILINLVRNAIKFTNEGSIALGYALRERESAPLIEFYVKDTGIGIPSHKTEIIFNRFEQAESDHERRFEGSGLGLSIAKAYVELLGGNIWVETTEGKGSVFYFTIPWVPAEK